MRYLTIEEVLELHRLVITQSGGGSGVRDPNALDSALAQPRMTFGGVNLYPTAVEKTAALGNTPVMNQPLWTAASGSSTGEVIGVGPFYPG